MRVRIESERAQLGGYRIMRKFLAAITVCLALAVVLASTPVYARDLPAKGLTREIVASWLKGRGYSAEIKADSTSGDLYVATSANGVNFGVYFYGCTDDVCPDIQYSAGWSDASTITTDKLNEWNRDNRYCRAYLSKAGGVFGEYDVDVAPGGSWEQLDHSLDRYVEVLSNFKTFLGY